jgi:4-amino-4-deoxy-L-arabinose transferase-like glycosyltransferase
VIGILWAIAVLPNLPVRGFRWEEGNNAVLARDMLVRHDWWEPAIFGLRYVEKPSLFSGLIAGAAQLTGGVNEWSARLPAMLAVLATAILVERLTRRYASAPAALFAACAFMFSPMILRKITVGEPDTLVTLLSFTVLLVWWNGEERGRVTRGRWLACGALLALLTLVKGPQPLGFFTLGAGGYLIVSHRWAAFPGLALCLTLPTATTIAWAVAVYRTGDFPVWLTYMRLHDVDVSLVVYARERLWFAGGLLLDLLASTVLLPSAVVAWRRDIRVGGARSPILLPLALYASLCTLALLVWPDTKTRYAMPIAPAVAVTAGLAFDDLWRVRRWVAQLALATAAVLFLYQVALVSVVLPLFPHWFHDPRKAIAGVEAAIRTAPAPVFVIGYPRSNQLFYLKVPIQSLSLTDSTLAGPAWVLAERSDLKHLVALRTDLSVHEIELPAAADLDFALARVERRWGAAP